MQSNLKQYVALLIPSWLSGVFTATVSIVATLLAVVIANGSQNVLRDGVDSANSLTGPTLKRTVDLFAQSTIVSNLPLILLYAAVGVLVYLLALHVINGLRGTVELTQTMGYVNGHKDRIVVSTLTRLVIRVVIVVAWLIYAFIFIKTILPKFTVLTHSVVNNGLIQGILDAVLAAVLLALAVHIHVVFFRFFLLRRISGR